MTGRSSPPRPSAVVRWRRRFLAGHSVLMIVLCTIVALLFFYPLVMLGNGAFRTAPPGLAGSWSVDGFVNAYTTSATYATLKNSLLLSLSIQLFTVALGVFFAWVVARTTSPLRRLVTPIMVVVFAVPLLFYSIAWGMLANDPSGLINRAYMAATGSTQGLVDIESWYGLIGVSVLKFVSAAYLLMLGPFMALDRSQEEASLVLGASEARTFFRISLPLLAPTVAGVAILGFVLGLGALEVPLLFGVPAGIDVFSTEILGYVNNSTPPDYAGASSLSLLLIVVMVVMLLLQQRALGSRQFTTVTGKSHSRRPTEIGRWRYLCTAAIVLYAVIGLLLPLVQLVIGSLQPIFGLYGKLTLDNYRAVLTQPDISAALTNTVLVGVVVGFIATSFAFVISYAVHRSRSRLRRLPGIALWLLLAAPGITLSLAIAWAYLSVPGLQDLYATIWLAILALAVGLTPIAARATAGAVVQIGAELEEASRVSGASGVRAMVGITGRLILPSFASGWLVTGILAAGNFDMLVFLSTPDSQTAPLVAYQLYTSGDSAQAAAIFCLMLAVVVLTVAVVGLLTITVRHLKGGRAATSANTATPPTPLPEPVPSGAV